MMNSLLPPELWDYVLTFLESTSLQSTALSLSRAIPSSSISPSLLWRHLHLSRESQALQCISKLRGMDQGVRESIKTVRATAFREDPQQLVNLLLSLPSARSLQLHIGPLFSPEQLDELLTPLSSLRSKRFTSLSQLSFRFNPYCMERSYFVFLKGTYFDSIVLNLSSWTLDTAPKLKRLDFNQDLSPNHGVKRKDTPAFGLHEIRQELNDIEEKELEEEEERIMMASRQPPASGRFGRKNKIENGKMDFAQPIVFFRLDCLATLSVSPIGRQLTHLTLRLPRRNLLTALTLQTSPSNPPFPSLTHLDLSTTHIMDDARFPTMLRLMPGLESLVLDRCTGLISQDAVDENTAIQTMRWLGKCCGGFGFSRAEEISRSWKRIVKSRPTDAPNIVGSTSHIPPVKELFLVPSLPNLTHLGLGLHDSLSASTTRVWSKSFRRGYVEALEKSKGRIQELLDRWELWERQGKLLDGTRRLCTFSDALTTPSFLALHKGWNSTSNPDEEEPDPLFSKFLQSRQLATISPSLAYDLLELHDLKLKEGIELCFEPDCSDLPGVPRLSFEENGKDSMDERERKEKLIDQIEKEDEERRKGRRHEEGCAHRRGREAWELEK